MIPVVPQGALRRAAAASVPGGRCIIPRWRLSGYIQNEKAYVAAYELVNLFDDLLLDPSTVLCKYSQEVH